MKKTLFIILISTLLIVLWVYAAGSKLAGFTEFGHELQRQPLPEWSISVLKWSLPTAELSIAVLIYFQRTRLTGLIVSSILMVAFTLYVAIALSGALKEIPCSCAGIISMLHWKGHLVFNIAFTLISFAGIYLEKHKDDRFVKHKHIAV